MVFLVVSLLFALCGFGGTAAVRLFYNKGPSTNLLHITLVITTVVCCWMTWALVYLSQMHPLVNPVLKGEGE